MTASARFCYYGDDLTGSTDALANFTRFGLSVRLVLRLSALERLEGQHDVLGVAGRARALPTGQLEAELAPALAALARLGPEVLQYKVCSTFDSSPEIGSIGRACEIASAVLGRQAIPVVPAQPDLGRWTVFSNHFARGVDGRVHRLDRHPTMAAHPVTPATEADLGRVLAAQCPSLPVAALHLHELEQYPVLAATHQGPIVLDVLDNADLRRIGALVRAAPGPRPRFAVGSGGLSYGLAASLGGAERRGAPPGEAGPVLALSGSGSPDTARQIARASEAGWAVASLLELGVEGAAAAAVAALGAGRSAAVHSTLGPPPGPATVPVGERLGLVACRVLGELRLRRLLVAGGDTSGAVMAALGGEALDYLAPVGGNGVLCTLRAPATRGEGLQVVLKGGQIGGEDFFELVRQGR